MNPSASASRSDQYWSLAWITIGAAIFYGGWSMDRLEKLNINPYTAPGLVPAALGIGIALLGLVLLLRSLRVVPGASNFTAGDPGTPTLSASDAFSLRRFFIALALCLAYGAGLVGRGVPFWLATFLFVSIAIAVLQWPERRVRDERGRGLLIAAACGAGTALAVTLVFQEVFLVRLP